MANMSTHEHTQSASITCMYGWTFRGHVVAYLKVKIGLPRVVPLLCEGGNTEETWAPRVHLTVSMGKACSWPEMAGKG